MAFFPCIYFCAASQMMMSLTDKNLSGLTMGEKYASVLERSRLRQQFLELLIMLCGVCETKGIRLIVENPWSMQTFLKSGFIKAPALVDNNRALRGDYYTKPTAYWYINCNPTCGLTLQINKKPKRLWDAKRSGVAGLCSEERSMISPDYARNFICDFILGKEQKGTQLNLFD